MAVPATKKVFHVAGVVNPERHYVVNRSAWHTTLTEKLARGAFVLLHAHRQAGKSSAARAVGTLMMRSGYVVVTCTIESARPTDETTLWKALETRMAGAMSALPPGSIPSELAAQIASGSGPLFHDSTTFEAMFDRARWAATTRIVLVIDEFDTLLEAPDAVKCALLTSLQSLRTRNAIAPDGSSGPSALCSVLGIGMYQLLQLAGSAEHPCLNSPFNVSDAESVPPTTVEHVRAMLAAFSADVEHVVPDAVIADLHWRSGGHVGLLSLLGQHLAQLCSRLEPGASVDSTQWFAVANGSSLLGALRDSATVASMLHSMAAARQTSPASHAARSLVRDMLSAPEDAWLGVAGADSSRSDALAYLMTEGVIVMDRRGPTAVHRIVAPVVVPLLMRNVESKALVARMPVLTFPRHANGSINLMQTLMELLPFINMEALYHPFAIAKGVPCEYAYHFQLYDLLSRRASVEGWRLFSESRNSAIARGGLQRLDLFIACNGHRCGIVLLAEGGDLIGHLCEQAPIYCTQQKLNSLLILNFSSLEASIVPSVTRPLPMGVELLQVLVSRADNTLTPFLLGGEGGLTAQACCPIAQDAADATESLVSSCTALSPASARPTIVACGGSSWILEPLDTIGTLLSQIVADLGLGQRHEMWMVRANGAEWKLGQSQRVAHTLPAVIASGQGTRLEIRVGSGSKTACGAPLAREVKVK